MFDAYITLANTGIIIEALTAYTPANMVLIKMVCLSHDEYFSCAGISASTIRDILLYSAFFLSFNCYFFMHSLK